MSSFKHKLSDCVPAVLDVLIRHDKMIKTAEEKPPLITQELSQSPKTHVMNSSSMKTDTTLSSMC